MLAFLAFWLLVMGVLYLGMQQYLKPAGATVLSDGSLRIPRAKDGHFRVAGSINGQAGLSGGTQAIFRTANGERQGRVVRADEVRVGPLAVGNVRVGTGYTGDEDDDALLGQAFLRHFDVRMRGDEMLLQPRGKS